jgi:hypothetical protein
MSRAGSATRHSSAAARGRACRDTIVLRCGDIVLGCSDRATQAGCTADAAVKGDKRVAKLVTADDVGRLVREQVGSGKVGPGEGVGGLIAGRRRGRR